MHIFGEKITLSQVEELYENLKVSLVGLLGVVAIISGVLYFRYDEPVILLWTAGMFAINGYRYYTYRHYLSNKEKLSKELSKAFFAYLIPMGLSGVLFSSLVFFFFPSDPEYDVFLLILLTGIISSGVVQNAQTRISTKVF